MAAGASSIKTFVLGIHPGDRITLLPPPEPLDEYSDKWLGEIAEGLGVEVYPGFSAAEVLFDENKKVIGVATGDMGVSKEGLAKGSWEPGMELKAKYTLFSEGSRGSLSKFLIKELSQT